MILARLCKEAGIPDGVVNVVSGLGQTGNLLAKNMVIRKISFTGSTATGRAVQKAATESNLKVSILSGFVTLTNKAYRTSVWNWEGKAQRLSGKMPIWMPQSPPAYCHLRLAFFSVLPCFLKLGFVTVE